ncbi:glycine, glutamate and proline-rich protein-like [Biomphalaria glabrata]|uniref:Glycine, glutamate and proline-rich protein-like n=1 Tax=Biomphalaria glabrata TaxID=6526 RepID=A0A9W2YNS7_BIOGL|nr:glycine, glutamate and proline-rich protein-like [Biomphalaria glabrata]KAI8736478.1 G-type lysozyme [Biomphalaria glabrata]
MRLFIICALLSLANAANRLCNGDVMTLHPTGKASGGVAASHAEVQHDVTALEKHRHCYQASADNNCIQASVIAAVASRESRGGTLLVATHGYGDLGHAWGIMQCDTRYSGLPCTSVPWDSCEHIEMMVHRMLVPNVHSLHTKHPAWPMSHCLQGAVAGYNCGLSRVTSFETADTHTTGHDYSNDVIARAQWLHQHGWN